MALFGTRTSSKWTGHVELARMPNLSSCFATVTPENIGICEMINVVPFWLRSTKKQVILCSLCWDPRLPSPEKRFDNQSLKKANKKPKRSWHALHSWSTFCSHWWGNHRPSALPLFSGQMHRNRWTLRINKKSQPKLLFKNCRKLQKAYPISANSGQIFLLLRFRPQLHYEWRYQRILDINKDRHWWINFGKFFHNQHNIEECWKWD